MRVSLEAEFREAVKPHLAPATISPEGSRWEAKVESTIFGSGQTDGVTWNASVEVCSDGKIVVGPPLFD